MANGRVTRIDRVRWWDSSKSICREGSSACSCLSFGVADAHANGRGVDRYICLQLNRGTGVDEFVEVVGK